VSVHATDPDVRARLLAHPGLPPVLPRLRRLADGGIKVHAQVVLCPGINDGPVLERTVFDLADLSEVVESVAVVPVGISAHLKVRNIRPVLPEHAVETLRSLRRWHRRFRRSLGRGFVYPSDELFLMANARLPGPGFYDGYPQLQNGVGLTRLLLADWRRHRSRLPARLAIPRRVIWLCGRAARAALTEMARDINRVENLSVEARVVENTLFGEAISVSGLMSGRDAVTALSNAQADIAVLPRSAFGHEGTRTLDDWTVGDIERAAGTEVRLAQSASELIRCTVA
jgi:putative radical SAM enzyme (TIGR03279 family)